ncbi:MAG TPA: DUF72 domain-containing protein [Candidatus Dormibacteraeota bacterium]|jgi:uncharacterized protein YecE (DUF72 family)|nr:DUF72 domain-containing protein [Candidatus Dormibacteraeota bacterium]
MAGQIRIGCSGWSYPHWRKQFYPEKLPAREHFAYYAQHFDTVELNNSFYRQPTIERFQAWRAQAPPGFLFAVKGSRYVTHIKRLAVEQQSIDMVVEPALGLGEKLGPILFQLQANFRLDLERLERFVGMLPDHLRFTIEFRHDSWLVAPVCDLLRRRQIALCIPDHPKMPKVFEITSDFTYIRMHLPPHGLGYGRRALEPWAERILDWSTGGLDVFVYFNNDMEGHAIKDATALKELVARS